MIDDTWFLAVFAIIIAADLTVTAIFLATLLRLSKRLETWTDNLSKRIRNLEIFVHQQQKNNDQHYLN